MSRHTSIRECVGGRLIFSKYYEEHVPKTKKRRKRLPAAVRSRYRGDEAVLTKYETMSSRQTKVTRLRGSVKMGGDFMKALANVNFHAEVWE